MDWTKQAEEMISSWSRTLNEMWDRTLKVAQAAASEPDAPAAGRVAEAWRQSVLRALQAQVEWTRIWAERIAERSGAAPEVAESARRFQAMIENWTAGQTRLWEAWFTAAGKLAPKTSSTAWTAMVREWQEAARKAVEAQAEWANRWTGARPKPGGKRTANAISRTRRPRPSSAKRV